MHSTVALLFFGLIFTFLFNGVHPATVTFTNRCPYPVWPANLNGNQRPQLSKTGFLLAQGATESVDVPSTFSGLFWPRSQCSTDASGKFTCLTGDCDSGQVECQGKGGKPPLTQIEFTFNQNGGQDTYDISLVNGFNVPVSVTPQGGTGVKCNSISCSGVNNICPRELVLNGPNNDVIACKSACDEFKEPRYCCTGEFSPRGSCKPTEYSTIFKNQCPQAYSYAHDDETSTFTCNTGANYAITFCPLEPIKTLIAFSIFNN